MPRTKKHQLHKGWKCFRRLLVAGLWIVALDFATLPGASAGDFDLSIEQLTSGEKHHFFGYIGQCRTIPWNSSGRYIVALRTDFHDRMPKPGEAADVPDHGYLDGFNTSSL